MKKLLLTLGVTLGLATSVSADDNRLHHKGEFVTPEKHLSLTISKSGTSEIVDEFSSKDPFTGKKKYKGSRVQCTFYSRLVNLGSEAIAFKRNSVGNLAIMNKGFTLQFNLGTWYGPTKTDDFFTTILKPGAETFDMSYGYVFDFQSRELALSFLESGGCEITSQSRLISQGFNFVEFQWESNSGWGTDGKSIVSYMDWSFEDL